MNGLSRSLAAAAGLPAPMMSVFRVSERDRAWAIAVLEALEGTGVATLSDGSMVDAAMGRRARAILGEQASS